MADFYKKIPIGGINTDDTVKSVNPPFPETDYLHSENTRLSGTDSINNVRVSVLGNLEIPNDKLPAGVNKTIGRYEDKESKSWFFMNFNDGGNHQIWRYLENDNVFDLLAKGTVLNFKEDWLCHSINLINSEILQWTDGRENPNTGLIEGNGLRQLNIIKASSYKKKREWLVYFDTYDILNYPGLIGYNVYFTLTDPDGNVVETHLNIPAFPVTSKKEFLDELADKINTNYTNIDAEACDCHLKITCDIEGAYNLTGSFFILKGGGGLPVVVEVNMIIAPSNFYSDALIIDYIDRAKYPLLNPPTFQYGSNPDFNKNYIATGTYQFCTQLVYDNNEYSPISVVSHIAFLQNLCGTDPFASNKNKIVVDFTDARLNNGSVLAIVKNLILYVRYGLEEAWGEWRVVKVMDRCDFEIISNQFEFYNDGNYPVQSAILLSAENYMPRIANGQEYAANRGYIGGTLEGFDNVDCPEIIGEVTYKSNCEQKYGTITGRVFFQNKSDDGVYQNFQPIYKNSEAGDEITFGGVDMSVPTILKSAVADLGQYLYAGGTIIYSARDPQGIFAVGKQIDIPGATQDEKGVLTDIDGSLLAVGAAMAAGQVYQEFTIENVPIGTHILRVAGNLCAETGTGIYKFPGSQWQKSSSMLLDIGGKYSEIIVDVTDGGTVSVDINILDASTFDDLHGGDIKHSVVCGYLIDGEGLHDTDELSSYPNIEGAAVAPIWPGAPTVVVLYPKQYTDHNGFFFYLFEGSSPIADDVHLQAVGSDTRFLLVSGDQFYTGDYNLAFTTPVDLVLSTTFAIAVNRRSDVVIFNRYEDFSEFARTQITGTVKNSEGIVVSGVTVTTSLTNRLITTDGSGNYKILVYANCQEGPTKRTAELIFSTGTGCCIDFPDGDNRIITINRIAELPAETSYNMDRTYATVDFIMDIDGFDVELVWPHGSVIEMGIEYSDEAGRKWKVQEGVKLIIPPYTDINGNEGKAILSISVNHVPPIKAVKWRPVRKLNSTYNRWLDFIVTDIQYVKLFDLSADPPVPETTTYDAGDAAEIYMSLITVINYGQQNTGSIISYIPEKGDRVTLLRDSEGVKFDELFDFQLEFRGNGDFASPYILVIKNDLGLPELKNGTLVRMYTPKRQLEDDFYFEFGESYDILDAGLPTRRHGKGKDGQAQVIGGQPATAVFNGGEAFLRSRKMFYLDEDDIPVYKTQDIEDQYIYDDDPTSKQLDIGAPNIADKDYREYYHKGRIRFSGLFNTDGNKLFNGLCRFAFEDFQDADITFGGIRKLIKVGEKTELLAVQSHKVQPCYVNKAEIWDLAKATGQVTASDSPLQLGIPFKKPWGTQHPESIRAEGNYIWCFEYAMSLFWFYAENDLENISERFKIKKDIIDLVRELQSQDQSKIHVVVGNDRINKEIVWSFKALEPVINAREEVPVNFDGRTFSFAYDRNNWETEYKYLPEQMDSLGEKWFYSWKDGKLWKHEAPGAIATTFYGVKSPAVIVIPFIFGESTLKDFLAMRQKASAVWGVTKIIVYPSKSYPLGMQSRITANRFIVKEGDFWAAIMNDMLDPAFATQLEALFYGRNLKGSVLEIWFENNDDIQATLEEVAISVAPSMETL